MPYFNLGNLSLTQAHYEQAYELYLKANRLTKKERPEFLNNLLWGAILVDRPATEIHKTWERLYRATGRRTNNELDTLAWTALGYGKAVWTRSTSVAENDRPAKKTGRLPDSWKIATLLAQGLELDLPAHDAWLELNKNWPQIAEKVSRYYPQLQGK